MVKRLTGNVLASGSPTSTLLPLLQVIFPSQSRDGGSPPLGLRPLSAICLDPQVFVQWDTLGMQQERVRKQG